MGLQASIDIQFSQDLSPKDIVIKLINSGWKIDFEGCVTFIMPTDIDDYDWKTLKYSDFKLEEFINFHSDENNLGIVLVSSNNIGGEFLIYSGWMSFSLSINRVYLSSDTKIVDFSFYLEKLRPFTKMIKVSSIQCELTY
ncbi:hypothetical protein EKN56_03225 [Limnobaculum zhutongyuii]|uniref:Uncharacterized protein n=1 Tax=Limnobaculum zhutongyuii TaxID=2498113 RepID=A0A411WHI6_9GAMM|nr:hypothetical protein [Limnobaculum zhutongyuii]QBH95504.1 hypothetical protein EKN56_03225 [Limnobaculum zhutongyuii]TQS88807.1 hypothetical protein ELQ32_09370 [Limnobaculum zhutongyuii]